MYTLRDLLDPNNPLGERYNDYHGLYMVAYDIEPSNYNFESFMAGDEQQQLIQIRAVRAAIDDTVMLLLESLRVDMPEWMMNGAPDPATFQRWVETGLLSVRG